MNGKVELRPFGSLFAIPLRNGLNRPTAVRGSGVKMVNMGELFAHSRIGNIPMECVPLSESEAEVYLLQANDLLFARQSLVLSGAGKCSIFLGSDEPVTYEGHIIRVRLDQSIAEPKFYYYFFNSPDGRQSIETIAEQVAAAGIRGSDLAKLHVPYPQVESQRAIARILGTLDDKIELNRRMNRTLEAMAAALFKSWFVDFDPVTAKAEGRQPYGMNAETAALFPPAFQDSEMGPIPRAWRVGTIGEIGDNIRRSISPGDVSPGTPYIGLEHMPRKSIELSGWGRAEDVVSGKFQFREGEILFGKLRPYFHKVGVAPVDGVCSTDVLVIVPQQPEWFGLLLGHLSSVDFINFVDAASEGTRMPRTSWETMARYPIAVPDSRVVEAHTKIITSYVARIHANIKESRTLAAIRYALLPKLLSGEIRVK